MRDTGFHAWVAMPTRTTSTTTTVLVLSLRIAFLTLNAWWPLPVGALCACLALLASRCWCPHALSSQGLFALPARNHVGQLDVTGVHVGSREDGDGHRPTTRLGYDSPTRGCLGYERLDLRVLEELL